MVEPRSGHETTFWGLRRMYTCSCWLKWYKAICSPRLIPYTWSFLQSQTHTPAGHRLRWQCHHSTQSCRDKSFASHWLCLHRFLQLQHHSWHHPGGECHPLLPLCVCVCVCVYVKSFFLCFINSMKPYDATLACYDHRQSISMPAL